MFMWRIFIIQRSWFWKIIIFEFDEKVYRQKLGTAIGAKFPPAFANIFMTNVEKCFLETCVYGRWVWWRFLGDIFVVWLYGKEMLESS